MKGYFTLKYDHYTDELSFGNLGENGSFGTLRDCIRGLDVKTTRVVTLHKE